MIILGIIGLLFAFYLFKDILALLFWGILIAIITILLIKLIKHIKPKNKIYSTNKDFCVDNVNEWFCPECDYKNKSGHICKSCGYEAKVKNIETNKSIHSYSAAELGLLAKTENSTKKGYVFACDYPVCDAIKDSLNNRFIAFDVETTGLSPENDRIVEIGAVLFENRIPVKRFGTLVNPKVEIPPRVTKINNITNDMLLTAPLEEPAYSDLIEFLGDAFSNDLKNIQTFLCAHNAKFDMDFLSQTLERLGYNGNIKYVDTLSAARRLIYDVENYKQPTLAKYFGIINQQEHRAVSDAEVCGNILIKLLDLLQEIQEKQERKEVEKRQRKEELERIRKDFIEKRNEIKINPINDRVPLNDVCNLNDVNKGFEMGCSFWESGDILRKDGNLDEAIKLFDKARYYGYSAPALYNSYAMAYRKLKDYDNEIYILDEAINRYENDTLREKFELRRYRAICLLIKQKENEKK